MTRTKDNKGNRTNPTRHIDLQKPEAGKMNNQLLYKLSIAILKRLHDGGLLTYLEYENCISELKTIYQYEDNIYHDLEKEKDIISTN